MVTKRAPDDTLGSVAQEINRSWFIPDIDLKTVRFSPAETKDRRRM